MNINTIIKCLQAKEDLKKLRGPVSEPVPETSPAEEDRSVAPTPPKLAGKDMAAVEEAVTLPAGGQGAAVASEAVTLPTPSGGTNSVSEAVTLPTPVGRRDVERDSATF